MSLGRRLKRLRLQKGKSQLEMAKELNINNATLSQYEADNRKPDIVTLKAMATYFDVSADYLLFDTKTFLDPNEFDTFDTAEDAAKFLLEQNVIMGHGGFNINELSSDEIIEFANELLSHIKLLSFKYKK